MLLIEELNNYKPWLISVGLTGSSVLPWIEKPNDTDYIFYVTNNRTEEKLFSLMKEKPYNECWFVQELDKATMAFYAYEYHFIKPIFGEKFPDYDVLQHIVDYKKILIQHINNEFNPKAKYWYHILTGIYLIQNGKYELTEEQAQNVNLCHDKKMTLEIYNSIQEQLLIYKKELEELKKTKN